MPVVGRKERRRELTFNEREAAVYLRAVMEQQKLTFKKLAKALGTYGVELSPSTLANRLARGQFSLAFFLICMRAAGLKSFRLQLGPVTAKELAELAQAEENKKPRKPPEKPDQTAEVSISGTTNSARNPPR